MGAWTWLQLAGWPPHGEEEERNAGAALLLHAACRDVLQTAMEQVGLPLGIFMQDVYRHLVRGGCPDASPLPYGTDLAPCWHGHNWEAPPGNEWLLAEPALDAAPPPSAPPPRLQPWAEQPGSLLLALPDDLLARAVNSLDEADRLQACDSLARCCRQLRAAAAGHPAYWQGKCLREAPFLDWRPLLDGPGRQMLTGGRSTKAWSLRRSRTPPVCATGCASPAWWAHLPPAAAASAGRGGDEGGGAEGADEAGDEGAEQAVEVSGSGRGVEADQ
ncbi:hypothetical protein ABPG75_013313 [Micractinium tetrahymenae]